MPFKTCPRTRIRAVNAAAQAARRGNLPNRPYRQREIPHNLQR
ncbi:MAG TPA: hypothetical protein VF527_02250 [Pyrinomonadaceae bacterium]